MIKGFILAIQFLTRLPAPVAIDFNSENIRTSLKFYPLIGALIGVLSAIPLIALPDLIGCWLSLIVYIIVTGGLHLDGVGDVFDGFLSNRPSEMTYAIMKDSRVGTFGVVGLFILLSGKVAMYYKLISFPLGVILSAVYSRWLIVWVLKLSRNAFEGGLGKIFKEGVPGVSYSILTTVLLSAIGLYNIRLLLPLLFILPLAFAIVRWSYVKIGGISGDVNGLIIEYCDLLSLLVFSVAR